VSGFYYLIDKLEKIGNIGPTKGGSQPRGMSDYGEFITKGEDCSYSPRIERGI
jgi:hypothetical protein